jgi:hypothetical protein
LGTVWAQIFSKGQAIIRFFGLYANAHRGKVRKAADNFPYAVFVVLRMLEMRLGS